MVHRLQFDLRNKPALNDRARSRRRLVIRMREGEVTFAAGLLAPYHRPAAPWTLGFFHGSKSHATPDHYVAGYGSP